MEIIALMGFHLLCENRLNLFSICTFRKDSNQNSQCNPLKDRCHKIIYKHLGTPYIESQMQSTVPVSGDFVLDLITVQVRSVSEHISYSPTPHPNYSKLSLRKKKYLVSQYLAHLYKILWHLSPWLVIWKSDWGNDGDQNSLLQSVGGPKSCSYIP